MWTPRGGCAGGAECAHPSPWGRGSPSWAVRAVHADGSAIAPARRQFLPRPPAAGPAEPRVRGQAGRCARLRGSRGRASQCGSGRPCTGPPRPRRGTRPTLVSSVRRRPRASQVKAVDPPRPGPWEDRRRTGRGPKERTSGPGCKPADAIQSSVVPSATSGPVKSTCIRVCRDIS
jgi:hypothetical protein